jgi:hypothetical protein
MSGDFSMSGTASATAGAAMSIAGSFTVGSGATFTTGAYTHTIGGDFSNSGTFTATGSTITLNGTGAQTISGTTTPTTFGTLTINKGGGTATLGVNVTMAADLTVAAGTLDLSTFTANRTAGGGTLTVSNGATLKIGGTNTLPANYNTHTFGSASTIEYSGTAQAVSSSETYGNLTINQSSGDATLGGAATVNGILTLTSGNLAVTDPYVLTMGASATTVGAKDVTGIVKRTTLVAGTTYTFGNQYTTINFQNVGTLPTDMSVKISIGSAPGWKTDAVQRTYDIIQNGAIGSFATLNLHYLDAELNGNTEDKLVLWAYDTPTVVEYGRSNYDLTNNWVGISSLETSYFPAAFGSIVWTLGDSALANSTWDGSASTVWTDPDNWTNDPPIAGIPSDLADVVIPDASTTPNDPTLGLALAVGRLTLESGGILNSADSSVVTISGSSGAWSNDGGTFYAGTSTVVFTNPIATVSGVTDFYNVTIDSGAGLTMGSGSIMRIGGTMTNDGIWPAAGLTNATIEYNGADQTVLNPNGVTPGYDNLILSGSGTKTMPGAALSIGGNFSMSGTASTTAGAAMSIAGSFTVGSGATFTTGAYTHTIGGDFSNSGTFTATGSTITLNGTAAQAIGGTTTTAFDNLAISNTSAAVSANTNFSVGGTLTVDSSAVLNPAAAVVISGAGTLTGNGTVNVTRIAATADFSSQYTISNTTLTNLTAAYVGSAAQTVSALTYGGLNINNANGVTLGGNATVNGTLTLTSGKITTGSSTVIIGSSGTVSGGSSSSYVYGNLQKNVATGAQSPTFEVGTASNYNPVTVAFGNVSGAGNLTASVTAGEQPNIVTSTINSSKDVNAYWTLTNSGISFDNYSATFTFVAGDIDSGANTSAFIVGKYNGGWIYPTVGTKTDTSTQATGMDSLSDFAVGEALTVAFDTTSSSGDESATPALLGVSLSGTSDQTVTVDYAVTGGSATGGGVDYTLDAGTLTFIPGDTAEDISIAVVDDALDENDETIEVTLSNPTNATLGANTVHTYTINDNDAMGGGGVSDTTPPTISDISVSNITETSADIAWKTGGTSDSQVEYWSSPSKLSPLDTRYVTKHLIHLTGLTPCTTYSYQTMSRDRAGNLAISDVYTFTTLGEATFTSNDLSISPSQVSVGEKVNISVVVTNTGSCPGSYTVTLKIIDVVEATSEVTLDAGASKEVAFTTAKDEAGNYSVDVNGLSGSFTVKEEADHTAGEEVTSPPEEGVASPTVNWPMVGGIIAGLVVIGLIILFVARRKAA